MLQLSLRPLLLALVQVGWDAARAVGIPELPRHGWMLMDFVTFPRYNVKTQIGWGYEHQHKRKSGDEPRNPMMKTMLDNDPDPDDEPIAKEPQAGAPLLSSQVSLLHHLRVPFFCQASSNLQDTGI